MHTLFLLHYSVLATVFTHNNTLTLTSETLANDILNADAVNDTDTHTYTLALNDTHTITITHTLSLIDGRLSDDSQSSDSGGYDEGYTNLRKTLDILAISSLTTVVIVATIYYSCKLLRMAKPDIDTEPDVEGPSRNHPDADNDDIEL